MAGAKLCGGDTAFLLRSHSHSHSHFLEAATRRAAPFPGRVSSVSPNPKPSRYRILAMTVKRSPKRLKYSAPQFTKLLVFYSVEKPLSILCRSLRDIDTYTTGFPRGDGQGHANIFRAVKHCLPGPDSFVSRLTLFRVSYLHIFCQIYDPIVIESHLYCAFVGTLVSFCLDGIYPDKVSMEQYTFILTASKEVPKKCVRYGTTTAKYSLRKHVGVRIPNDAICQAILQKMDAPLISTSVKWLKDNEWMVDPVVIADTYGPEGLDFVVDGGVRVAEPSTVVDMTGTSPKIIRQGKGPKLYWMEEEDANSTAIEDLIPSAT
ncbi:hypothetical protein CUMW_206980 [Citrus unshiu]|uniref:Threonylcarbamoyl-AMP synthase n=1 Tax=Citrus unshiu TaxID=55188 RepID=A0A2H5Q8W4_CITUN|nr:hypothetical protein CUMW_206980 [Citrus unshiu]